MLLEFKEALRGMGEKILERKSYAVLVGCFAFLFGVIVHSFFDIKFGDFVLYNLVLVAGAGIAIFWKNQKARLILLGVFFILAGFWRFDLSVRENKIFPQYFGKEIEITGVIFNEPISKMDKQQLVIRPEKIGGAEFYGPERILITTNLYPVYEYGERLIFFCKLTAPKEFPDFDYAKWLTINDIYGLCYWPEIMSLRGAEGDEAEVASDSEANSRLPRSPEVSGSLAMTKLLNFKSFLIDKVNNVLHEPYASFLSGLILGARSGMPPTILENFRRTGTTHIIAISGWNISFLSWLFMPALFVLGIRRGKAFYLMLVFIVGYTLLAGASASVVRAGLMGVCLLLAQKIGRLHIAGRALLYAVALMFLQNPRAIFDAGFWLSSAATFGLIYFSPILTRLLKCKSKFANDYIIPTITAIIFTLPISSYIFGSVSLWSLPANLLIVPLVPIAFVLALSGMVLAAALPAYFAAWALWPAAGALNYIIHAAGFLARLPGYSEWRMPLLVVGLYYAALLYFTFKKFQEFKLKEEYHISEK